MTAQLSLGLKRGRAGADDALEHMPDSVRRALHLTMAQFVGLTFAAVAVRLKAPEFARLWFEGKPVGGQKLRCNAWGGFWQFAYVRPRFVQRTGNRIVSPDPNARGRLVDEWEFTAKGREYLQHGVMAKEAA